MKKILLSLGAVSAIITNSHGFLGVGDVVYDPLAVAQAVKQVTALKKQVDLMKKTAAATCGVKDTVKLYKDMKQLTAVMEKYKVTLDDLDVENPKSQIGQMAQKIFQENQIFDNCNMGCNSSLKTQVCKNKQMRNVGEIATAMVYADELDATAKRLKDLGEKLAKSKDLKTSQDIGNAISLEMAQLELGKSKVEMMAKANASKCKADEDRLAQEQAKNIGKAVDTSGWVN